MSSSLPTHRDQDGSDDEISEHSYDVYILRLTPLGKYTMDDVINKLLSATNDIDSWIISRETTPKEHFHIVFQSYEDFDTVRLTVINFVYEYWPIRKRGFGNAQYNFSPAKSERQAITYLSKEGDYKFYGYEQAYIDECFSKSFLKKASFKTEFSDLCDEFMKNMTDEKFLELYYLLRAKYKLPIIVLNAKAKLLSCKVQRDPSYAIFLSKQ